jgi:hypothetical protein
MSRRRGEFEHRTSIFEGAFRAWSHLGGLDPVDVETKPASELDPLANPIDHDFRLGPGGGGGGGPSSSFRRGGADAASGSKREYPYEPLPRAGLAHPYVQAILSPWLGPDADNEAIQLGLTTLRTWWQHRRKGESGSAVAALGTEKMKGVVEGYTRHFFTLAHCLVVNDKEQPPRSLHIKMKELDKARKRGGGAGGLSSSSGKLGGSLTSSASLVSSSLASAASMAMQPVGEELVASLQADLTDGSLTPLERLHAAQRRQLAEAGGLGASGASAGSAFGGGGGGGALASISSASSSILPPIIPIKGRCIPGKIDLPGIVDAVTRQASQMVHRGAVGVSGAAVGQQALPDAAGSLSPLGGGLGGARGRSPSDSSYSQHPGQQQASPLQRQTSGAQQLQQQQQPAYGDPNSTPVVFVSGNGDIQIAMTVDGITCAHCVKIVETVLKGCNGNKSPIDGLLDAAADRALCSVLIRIDRASSARRIAHEASRNLAMVGYIAKAKEMPIVGSGADPKAIADLGTLSTAFEVVAATDPKDFFDWNLPCTCPDNGVVREDCPRCDEDAARECAFCKDIGSPRSLTVLFLSRNFSAARRHSQMNKGIFDAFAARESQVADYMAGCGMKFGMDCTCGPDCRCKNCPLHNPAGSGGAEARPSAAAPPSAKVDPLLEEPLDIDQTMEFDFGMDPASGLSVPASVPGPPLPVLNVPVVGKASQLAASAPATTIQFSLDPTHGMGGATGPAGYNVQQQQQARSQSSRNPSILSYGNGGGLRNMSLASDATFGRAMSGLSALSIDWENLEDFDLEVDHSAHINNGGGGGGSPGRAGGGGGGPDGGGGSGRRRSSVRRSFVSTGDKDSHVTFRV